MATNYPDFQSALRSQMHESATISHAPPPPPSNNFQGVVVSVAVAIGAVVMLLAFIRKIADVKADRKLREAEPKPVQVAQTQPAPAAAGTGKAPDKVEDKARDKAQPEGQERIGSLVGGAPTWSATEKFIEIAPERIEEIRRLFSEVSRTPNETARQKILEELCGRIRALRLISDAPELKAIDKLVASLEELFKATSGKPSSLTPSVLRTAAGAIVLLESLCKPGRQVDVVFDPPPRFLAVDDDPISRHAVAASLKKIFNQPDLAEQGQAALLLAAVNRYDAVFLDVEMPGMDGFEVCAKIHQTAANATTPVVFVTSHSDFDSRAKSAESGGHDLVGKPFQPMEITVKALTLLIKTRLQSGRPKEQPAPKKASAVQPQPHKIESSAPKVVTAERATIKPTASPANVTPMAPTAPASPKPAIAVPRPEAVPAPQPAHVSTVPTATVPIATVSAATVPTKPAAEKLPPAAAAGTSASGEDFTRAFMTHTPRNVFRLRNQLMAASEAADVNALSEILGEFYVNIHSLTGEAERAELKAVFHLSWGIERLIRKLLEIPAASPTSILHTIAAALDVIEELCRRQARWDLKNPPLQILVVDDDPIARRAMSNALQLGFGRPDCADGAEAALVLAADKTYDIIFLDVLMPGMDGFATCAKIRTIAKNSATPVVFVTSLSDAAAHEQANRCGGSGFISKPALPAEIGLTALTFGLSGRLQKPQETSLPQAVAEAAPSPVTALPAEARDPAVLEVTR